MATPDYMLGVGSASHAQQTARVMDGLEPVLLEVPPDVVLVPGDVNSTLAASLTACKLGCPVAHVEAALRSFDRSMPEEINRMLADVVSDLLFIHSPEALDNLRREGVVTEKVHIVAKTMIDTLVAMGPYIDALAIVSRELPVVFPVHPRTRAALTDGESRSRILTGCGSSSRSAIYMVRSKSC